MTWEQAKLKSVYRFCWAQYVVTGDREWLVAYYTVRTLATGGV
jgi:hypothetical protein